MKWNAKSVVLLLRLLLLLSFISMTAAEVVVSTPNPWSTVDDHIAAAPITGDIDADLKSTIHATLNEVASLLQENQYEEADLKLSTMPDMSRLSHCFPEYHVAKAEILTKSGKRDEGAFSRAAQHLDDAITCHVMLQNIDVGEDDGAEFDNDYFNDLSDNTFGQLHHRRADALLEIGQFDEAIQELSTAIISSSGGDGDGDGEKTKYLIGHLTTRSKVYEHLRRRLDCVADLKRLTALEPESSARWFELAQRDIFDRSKAVEAYKKAIELDPFNSHAWHFMGHMEIVRGNIEAAEAAFLESLRLNPAEEVHLVWGKALVECGRYREAIDRLMKCAFPRPQLSTSQGAECNHYLAVAYHGCGEFRRAVKHLNTAMELEPSRKQLDSWYQREYALFHHHYLDVSLDSYVLDQVMSGHWLDGWARVSLRMVYPPAFDSKTYTPQPPLNPVVRDLPSTPATLSASMLKLKEMVAPYRALYHLSSPGFLPNSRLQWAHALAVLDVAQRIHTLAATAGAAVTSNAGASGGCDGGFGLGDDGKGVGFHNCTGSGGVHVFGWRDAFDVAVKYRSFGGVTEPVEWCDTSMAFRSTDELTKTGYGETKLMDGDVSSHKYYTYFQRCFDRLKEEAIKFKPDDSEQSRAVVAGIEAATNVEGVLSALNMGSYQVEMQIADPASSSDGDSGGVLPGTRLVVEPSAEERGHYFVIRTFRDRPRVARYNQAMKVVWERYVQSIKSKSKSEDATATATVQCMSHAGKLYYLWVNMMPLNRGTAGVGLTMLQAMWVACGVEIHQQLPAKVQLDWEALLAPDSDVFVAYLMDTLLPDGIGRGGDTLTLKLKVKDKLNNLRKILAFLKSCDV